VTTAVRPATSGISASVHCALATVTSVLQCERY
jgi:hypothetical protein